MNPVHADAPKMMGADNWSWDKPRHGEHFRRCDYCGSINPDDLVAEPTWHADWADRKYGWPHKFYVDIPDRKGELDCVDSTNSAVRPSFGDWKRVADLTPAERKACSEWVLASQTWVQLAVRSSHHAKFYTEHLQDPAISAETKDAIHRISGLEFEWMLDGRVGWRPYEKVTDE